MTTETVRMETRNMEPTEKVWTVARNKDGSTHLGAFWHSLYLGVFSVLLSGDFINKGLELSVVRSSVVLLISGALFLILWVRKR